MSPAAPEPDRLDAHLGWHLEVRCACGRLAQIPVVLIVKRYGPAARLPALVARMRCGACGEAPMDAETVNDITAGAFGTGSAREAVRRPVSSD